MSTVSELEKGKNGRKCLEKHCKSTWITAAAEKKGHVTILLGAEAKYGMIFKTSCVLVL